MTEDWSLSLERSNSFIAARNYSDMEMITTSMKIGDLNHGIWDYDQDLVPYPVIIGQGLMLG